MTLESLSLQQLDAMERWAEELFRSERNYPAAGAIGLKLLYAATLRGIREERRRRLIEHADIRAGHYDHCKD